MVTFGFFWYICAALTGTEPPPEGEAFSQELCFPGTDPAMGEHPWALELRDWGSRDGETPGGSRRT